VRGIDVNDSRIAGYRSRPLQIEIGFAQVAAVHPGVRRAGDKNRVRIDGTQSKSRAKAAYVRHINANLAGYDDALSRSIETSVGEMLDVVDGRETVGGEIVAA